MAKKSKKSGWIKALVFIVLGAALVGGIAFSLQQRSRAEAEKKLNARKVKVEMRDIRKELNITGTVLPLSSVAVYSPVSGELRQIFVEEGQRVKNRQPLFSVQQNDEGQNELEARRRDLDKARIDLRASEENIERRKGVRDLFSNADNEKAETEYNQAKLLFDAAKDRLSLLENTLGLDGKAPENAARSNDSRLSLIYVRAPKDAVVTFVNKAVGEEVLATSVAADASDREILTLSDTDTMLVRSRILEADLASVNVGMSAAVKLDAFPDKPYVGRVSRISQQGVADRTGGYTYFVIDIVIAQPDKDVRAQMNASINLIVAERKQVLSLPANAVATLNRHSVVEIVPTRLGKPSYKSLKTGLTTDQYVELADNTFKAGDEVLEIDFSKLDLKALGQGKLGAEETSNKDNSSADDTTKKRSGIGAQ